MDDDTFAKLMSELRKHQKERHIFEEAVIYEWKHFQSAKYADPPVEQFVIDHRQSMYDYFSDELKKSNEKVHQLTLRISKKSVPFLCVAAFIAFMEWRRM